MDDVLKYGQENFNLPHDVIKLPSKGVFYKPKKDSLKIGYLTAQDENLLMSQNMSGTDLIKTLLRNKIYEHGFDVEQLLPGDVQAILLFLRNTAFGPEYRFKLKDPKTNSEFESAIILDSVDMQELKHTPDDDGLFSYVLPKTQKKVRFKVLNMKEESEIDELTSKYPKGMVAPVVTKKLETQIVDIDGNRDKGFIGSNVINLPISDSKSLRRFMDECQPKLNLVREVQAPSGENVTVNVTFGVEFFRPFFE
jgi:hypothetical protein